MKKSLLLVAAGLLMFISGQAQKAEIGGFYGISFNSQIRTYYGQFRVDNKANYGGQLDIALSYEMFAELLFSSD